VVAFVLVTAACGGGGGKSASPGAAPSGTPLDTVLASATKTVDAKSAKVALKIDVTGAGTPATTVTGSGAFDFSGRKGSLTVTIPKLGPLEVVLDGQTIYEKLPSQLAGALGGKQWIKIDMATIGQVSGIDISSLSSLRSSDPSQFVAFLKGASADTKEVGKETLRGAAVTHYKTTVDLKKAVADAPESARAGLESAFKLYTSQSLPADVWVDNEGRLRKMAYTAAITAQGKTSTVATDYEVYDYGTSVKATPPPADQVTDLAAALNQGRGG
jgi:hypothetical protein